MRLDRLHIRLPRGEGEIGPYWGVPPEVVACCAVNYDRVSDFTYTVEHRFWSLDASILASRLALTAGLAAPTGLSVSVRKRIPLAEVHKWNDRIGGLPSRFYFKCLLKMGIPKAQASEMLRGRNTACTFETWKEGLLQFLAGPPTNVLVEPLRRRLRERLRTAQFIGCVWDSLRIAVEVAGVRVRKDIRELKEQLYVNPWVTAELIKQFSQQCRAIAFRESFERNEVFKYFLIQETHEFLQLSSIGRSLPSPIYYKDPLPGYLHRMADPCIWDPDLLQQFRMWMEHWAFARVPTTITVTSAFSTSGCLEFKRFEGGVPRALHYYALWQFCFESLGGPRFNVDFGLQPNPVDPKRVSQRWRLVLGGCVHFMRTYRYTLPAVALEAPEKGLKLRIPTKTILPVLVLGGFLRSIADQFMVRDKRIAPSITPGDPLRHLDHFNKLLKEVDAVWRSLDCSFATDNFSFDYIRIIYLTLLSMIRNLISVQLYDLLIEIVEWLATPRRLLQDPASCEVKWTAPVKKLYWGAVKSPIIEVEIPDYFGEELNPGSMKQFMTDMDHYWTGLGTADCHIVTGRGAMMGDPTSWPGLPLMTLFNWERATPMERHKNVITTGDDALGKLTREENAQFSINMLECKTLLSKGKDFVHEHLGVYTEEFTNDGVRLPVMAISPIVGPPGGSKGESDWFTSPGSQQALNSHRRYTGYVPYSMSRFYPTWLAARHLGVPCQLPPRYGGISLPTRKFATWRDQMTHARWGQHVASRSNMDYILKGTGLYFGSRTTKVGNLSTSASTRVAGVELARMRGLDAGNLKSFKDFMLYLKSNSSQQLIADLSKGDKTLHQLVGLALNQIIGTEGSTKIQDIPEVFTRTDQLDALLRGERPEGGKTPSVFTLARRLRQTLSRSRAFFPVPKSDLQLIANRQRYLEVSGDMLSGSTIGLTKVTRPWREMDTEAKIAFESTDLPGSSIRPFDNG